MDMPADVLELLKKGDVENFNTWRDAHQERLIGIPRDTTLKGINLAGIDLSGMHFEDADLSGCNLSGANLSRSVFVRTNFASANLSNADCRDALFKESILFGTTRDGMQTEGCTFSKVYVCGMPGDFPDDDDDEGF